MLLADAFRKIAEKLDLLAVDPNPDPRPFEGLGELIDLCLVPSQIAYEKRAHSSLFFGKTEHFPGEAGLWSSPFFEKSKNRECLNKIGSVIGIS